MLILVLWAETYQTFGRKMFAELLKHHFSCPNGCFELKIFLSKMKLFYEYSQTLTKNVLAFGKKRSAWFSKQHFTCRGELFAENEMFHKKNSINTFFWTMGGNFSRLWRKNLRYAIKKSLYISRGMIRGKLFGWRPIFYLKNSNFELKLSNWRKKFRSFIKTAFCITRRVFTDCCQNFILRV